MSSGGFPSGTRYTPVPNLVFGPLLESIEDPAELKCTLRAFWLLHRKKSDLRYLTVDDMTSDPVLYRGLAGLDVPPEEAILRGLHKGVERGTFLHHYMGGGPADQEIFLLNDEPGRRALGRLQQNDAGNNVGQTSKLPPLDTGPVQSNIFILYEENIGMLTPLLADQLKEAEQHYLWPWVKEAFELAVAHNKRSWRYIEAILRRWNTEGKDDGESGRYTEKVSLKEYLRKKGSAPRGH